MLVLSDCRKSNGMDCMAGTEAMGQEWWVGSTTWRIPATERYARSGNRFAAYQMFLTALLPVQYSKAPRLDVAFGVCSLA